MPLLIPTNKFLKDVESFRSDKKLTKKITKALNYLSNNPFHPGLNIERITNDPTAWSARIDLKYRLSFEPSTLLESGNPDWSADIDLLRILSHDDLYQSPR